VTSKERALAEIADRIAQSRAAGLMATVTSWEDYYKNVQARLDTEIIIAMSRLSPTSTSPGSWSSATGKF
jgi:hypothetical protein